MLGSMLPRSSVAVASMPPSQPQLRPDLAELLRNSSSIVPTSQISTTAAGSSTEQALETKGSSSSSSSDLDLELTGRPPISMYIPHADEQSLSEFQCLVRKQIELFEADEEVVESQVR